MRIDDVPSQFCPPSHRYPMHQRGPQLEEYFGNYARAHQTQFATPRTYLPVYWSNVYFVRQQYRVNEDLESWLAGHLNPAEKYFTLVQCDDGIYEKLPADVLVFGAGGVGHVPIPLTCEPHPTLTAVAPSRPWLASFQGNLQTDPRQGVRRKMAEILRGQDGVHIVDTVARHTSVAEFVSLMRTSEFALCPRGYGRTSFRMYEAMQLGAIPVYIYDDPWLPYADDLDWKQFAVLCHVDQLSALLYRLRSYTAEERNAVRASLAKLYPTHFSLEGLCRQVQRYLESR